ncbi:MAG: CHASE2 domain-containing protein, partial [Gammaproteobacteria bacterium]|nr:CHASE2 domain-containing protein [Gammaproteobacteria bacterium]
MKSHFWSTDWFIGLIITIIVVFSSGSSQLQSLEREAYYWGVRATERFPSEKIAVIAIDDVSIANIGRWPWPRDVHAEMIKKLAEGGAKVIGQTVFFLEPQVDPGMIYIQELVDFFSNASFNDIPADIDALSTLIESDSKHPATADLLEFFLQTNLHSRLNQDIDTLKSRLFEAEQALDTDSKLAESLSTSNNVILAMPFILGVPRGKPDQELPDYVLKNSLSTIHDRVQAQAQGLYPVTSIDAIVPIPKLGPDALAIGHLNTIPDVDGAIRTEALVIKHYDRFYPSMALQLAAKSLNLNNSDIKVNLAESIELGSLTIKTDSELLMNTFYYSDIEEFPAF